MLLRDFLLLVEAPIISTMAYKVGGTVSGMLYGSITRCDSNYPFLGLAVSMTK